ncbi:MAG: hypothetical protein IJU50_08235, partial [Lachnospiraceae bacterium]|nr:hypothetical protein [Lachnospiraceae bacterium]
MNTKSIQNKKSLFPPIAIIFLIFYLFFFFLDGYVLHADSHSYLYMDLSREPVYPLFLAALRALCGESYFLTAASLLQNLFNAACCVFFAVTMIKEFSLDEKEDRLYPLLLALILMSPSLLTRFVAKRGSTFSCSIMTESLTIPLWLAIFALLYQILRSRSRKTTLLAALLITLAISTRKQMLSLLVLFFLVLVYAYVLPATAGKRKAQEYFSKGILARIAFCIALPAACFLLMNTGEKVCNRIVHGVTSGHTDSNNTLFTILLYASSPTDGELLTDSSINFLIPFLDIDEQVLFYAGGKETFSEGYKRLEEMGITQQDLLTNSLWPKWFQSDLSDLYGELLAQVDENELTSHYAQDGEHFSDSYDEIAIQISQPLIEEWLQAHHIEGTEKKALAADQVRAKLLSQLFPKKIRDILPIYLHSFLHGLQLTVSAQGRLFAFYSLAVYGLFLFLLLLSYARYPESPASLFASLVLLGILGNVGLTSLVIFTQTRYMIYNMALFYTALLMLFREGIAKGPSGLSEKEAENLLENLYPDPHYRVEAYKEELVNQHFPDKFDIHII